MGIRLMPMAPSPAARFVDSSALEAAFHAHKEGHTKFTRRMAINIADHFGTSPKHIVQQLERMTLLKRGSWNWFVRNGGFSKENYAEVRADRLASVRSAGVSRPCLPHHPPRQDRRDVMTMPVPKHSVDAVEDAVASLCVAFIGHGHAGGLVARNTGIRASLIQDTTKPSG